jgi:hypothetical protein
MQSTLKDPSRQLSLQHDFSVFEKPVAICELTSDLLRELFDQAVHYGFPESPLTPNRSVFLCINDKFVKITASLDADFLMMCVGSSRKKPFYLFSIKSLIYWESSLTVADIKVASEALDDQMEKRGYFDRKTHARTDLLLTTSFRVDEVFATKCCFYILSDAWTSDPMEVFDRPNLLIVLNLFGRRILCRAEDADEIREVYKPITKDNVRESTMYHSSRICVQMSADRLE